MKMNFLAILGVALMSFPQVTSAFVPTNFHGAFPLNLKPFKESGIHLMDDAMMNRLSGITRSYDALTERLGDPDVIGDSNLLMKVMTDRSKSEEVVLGFQKVCIHKYVH
jgi:hypothetical protein